MNTTEETDMALPLSPASSHRNGEAHGVMPGELYQAGFEAGYQRGREAGFRQGFNKGSVAVQPIPNGASEATASKGEPAPNNGPRRILLGMPCAGCRVYLMRGETHCPCCRQPVKRASFCTLARYRAMGRNLGRKRPVLQYLAPLAGGKWRSKCKFFNGGHFMLQSSARMVVLTVLLLAAGSALAQSTPTTNSYDIDVADQVTVNTCSTGEPVSLNGTVQVQTSVTTDSSGVNYFTVTAANNLTGIGQTTSASYAAADSDNYSSNTSDPSADMTVELKADLKSQGGNPTLTLVQSLHIVVDTAGNISAQVVTNSTSCGS